MARFLVEVEKLSGETMYDTITEKIRRELKDGPQTCKVIGVGAFEINTPVPRVEDRDEFVRTIDDLAEDVRWFDEPLEAR